MARINQWILPRYSKRDFTRLGKLDKAIVGFRYWITKNAL